MQPLFGVCQTCFAIDKTNSFVLVKVEVFCSELSSDYMPYWFISIWKSKTEFGIALDSTQILKLPHSKHTHKKMLPLLSKPEQIQINFGDDAVIFEVIQ